MNKDKTEALKDFIDMILKSWTYSRMTQSEKANALDALREAELFGTYRQRMTQLHNVYRGFLYALDYNSDGKLWRETDADAPRF